VRAIPVLALLLLVLAAGPSAASGIDLCSAVFDLTRGDEVRDRIRWWPSHAMDLHEDGLGWDGPSNTMWDGWVQVVEPIAVGRPNYAPESVNIRIRIDRDRWRGEIDGKADLEPETVYARYGLDGMRWSTWQEIPAAEGEAAKLWTHVGRLSVARPEREAFLEEAYRDARESPTGFDEEATLRRLVARDPKYLSRAIPGIGYVQVLHESSYHGRQRFRRIEASLYWVVPGPVPPLHEPGARWRYRESCRVDETGRLHVPAGADLRELDLRGTGVTDEGLAAVTGLPGLRVLDLSTTAVTDGGLRVLPELALLETLRLCGTGVTDAGLAPLRRLTRLTELDLRETAVTDEGLAALRRALDPDHRRVLRIRR
jgi:hypothetical protein